jgi:hypothetical protein
MRKAKQPARGKHLSAAFRLLGLKPEAGEEEIAKRIGLVFAALRREYFDQPHKVLRFIHLIDQGLNSKQGEEAV